MEWESKTLHLQQKGHKPMMQNTEELQIRSHDKFWINL